MTRWARRKGGRSVDSGSVAVLSGRQHLCRSPVAIGEGSNLAPIGALMKAIRTVSNATWPSRDKKVDDEHALVITSSFRYFFSSRRSGLELGLPSPLRLTFRVMCYA